MAAVAILGGVLVACADTGGGGEEAEALYGTVMTAVDDQLWVYGGSAGPAGSSPPVTGILPPGWAPNRSITVYAPDGDVLRRISLPSTMPGTIVGGRVLVDADSPGARYLIANLCDVPIGCGPVIGPLLAHITADSIERIPLHLPPADYASEPGAGYLTVVGQTDSTAWVLQQVADPTRTAYVEPQRLLAIETATGMATEVSLPSGLYGTSVLCLGGDELFAAQATLDDNVNLTAVHLLRRAATADTADWVSIFEMPVDRGYVGGGGLECLEASRELLLWLDAFPTEMTTISMRTGARIDSLTTGPDGGGARVLGVVRGSALVTSSTAAGVQQIWRRPSGSWEHVPALDQPREAALIVLDGRLMDARDVLASFQPGGGRLRVLAG